MRVLLTNHRLAQRGGSELYLYDVARALSARGHQPIAYAPFLGGVAEELRLAGVPVVRSLDRLAEPPDLIHGQHNQPTMAALLHFPRVPALFFCHGWLPWEEIPPRFPRILRYVAVDRLRRERLVSEEGIRPDLVSIVPNFVDLERFRPRTEPLPQRPLRALLLSNHAVAGEGFAAVLDEACRDEGVALEVAGVASGRPLQRPEDRLADFDLVFARGRTAIEAMAVGASVILCDIEGLGPMVTEAAAPRLAELNFGLGALRNPHRSTLVRAEVQRHDAANAAAVRGWIRTHAGLEAAIDRILALYHQARDEWRTMPCPSSDIEMAATAVYLERLAEIYALHTERLGAAFRELRQGGQRPPPSEDDISEEPTSLAADTEHHSGLERALAKMTVRARNAERELDSLSTSRAVRARRWLLERDRLARIYRWLRG